MRFGAGILAAALRWDGMGCIRFEVESGGKRGEEGAGGLGHYSRSNRNKTLMDSQHNTAQCTVLVLYRI